MNKVVCFFWISFNLLVLLKLFTTVDFGGFTTVEFVGDLNVSLCGKILYPTESVKCLGVKIDANLNWQYQVNDLSVKLNRANTLLFKIKIHLLCYFQIPLSYCSIVWAQNFRTIQWFAILQKKAVESLISDQAISILKHFICQQINQQIDTISF